MFSAAAVMGVASLVLLLGFAAYFLRELGAGDIAKVMLAIAILGFAASLAAAWLI